MVKLPDNFKDVLSQQEQFRLQLNLVDQYSNDQAEKLIDKFKDSPEMLIFAGICWAETVEGVCYWNDIYWRIVDAKRK